MTVRRAAAAFTPLWPARMAELWSAGAVSGSGAARACATCVVAAVATFGGLPAAVPDRTPAARRGRGHRAKWPTNLAAVAGNRFHLA